MSEVKMVPAPIKPTIALQDLNNFGNRVSHGVSQHRQIWADTGRSSFSKQLDGPDPRRLWDEQDSGHSKFIGLFQTLVETTMFLLPVAGIDFHRRS